MVSWKYPSTVSTRALSNQTGITGDRCPHLLQFTSRGDLRRLLIISRHCVSVTHPSWNTFSERFCDGVSLRCWMCGMSTTRRRLGERNSIRIRFRATCRVFGVSRRVAGIQKGAKQADETRLLTFNYKTRSSQLFVVTTPLKNTFDITARLK